MIAPERLSKTPEKPINWLMCFFKDFSPTCKLNISIWITYHNIILNLWLELNTWKTFKFILFCLTALEITLNWNSFYCLLKNCSELLSALPFPYHSVTEELCKDSMVRFFFVIDTFTLLNLLLKNITFNQLHFYYYPI